jgi:hypothetical protein
VPSLTTSTRRLRHLLIAGLAVAGTALMQASAASASVQWTSNAERPWNQEWANYSCQDASRVAQVTSPVAQGNKAYEITLRDGDDSYGERCELGQGNPTRTGFPIFQEGQERWVSFQVYLPDDYPIDTRDWNVIFQEKQLGSMGTPALSMEVQNGRFILMNADSNGVSGGTVQKWSGPAVRNQWVKFTVHTKFSPDPSVGTVELFGDLDGQGEKLLLPEIHTHTMKRDDAGVAVPSQARIGMYRNPRIEGTSHIFFDGYTIATDKASAEAAAFGDAGDAAGEQPLAQPPAPVAPQPTSDNNTSAPTSRPATTRKRRSIRVVLRTKRHRSNRLVHASGRWPRVLPVYGWVKAHRRHVSPRVVLLEIKRHGRWEWLTRGWLRSDGRFYLAAPVHVGRARTIKLRAHVAGLGNSRTLRARV